jgi:hypothetical protein
MGHSPIHSVQVRDPYNDRLYYVKATWLKYYSILGGHNF